MKKQRIDSIKSILCFLKTLKTLITLKKICIQAQEAYQIVLLYL